MSRRMLKAGLFFTCIALLLLTLSGCACKHETTELVGVVEATCTAEGYNGDAVCTECDEVVAKGSAIPATGHTEGELKDAADATCTAEGYTGDVFCEVCGEQLVTGEVIAKLEHAPVGELSGVVEADCVNDGYTGDMLCADCGEVITAGEAVPAAGHAEGEVVNAAEATCTEDGYTGDVFCEVCGEQLVTGEAVPAAGHIPAEPVNAVEAACGVEGYTGDILCEVCGELITAGEVIPAAEEHTFVDNVCACGWMEPGLYIDGAMAKSWAELQAEAMVVVEDGVLVSIEGDFGMGLLVVGEDVTYIEGKVNKGINCDTLTAVWLPETVSGLGDYLLKGNTTVTEVRVYGPVTELSKYAFTRAKALDTVYLPGTLEVIGEKAFSGCNVATIYFGGTAEQWEAIGGAAMLPDAEVITE